MKFKFKHFLILGGVAWCTATIAETGDLTQLPDDDTKCDWMVSASRPANGGECVDGKSVSGICWKDTNGQWKVFKGTTQK